MKSTPNPTGKHRKPFTLAPIKFDEALRRILGAKPEPKPDKPTKQKPAKRKK